MQTTTATTIAAIDPASWDQLVAANDPFGAHAFLSALESSGSAAPATGWIPQHVLVHAAGKLVAALPHYVKSHSYGEYIFDWAWADAAQRNGLAYYPKCVSAVPFTPTPGNRCLIAPELNARDQTAAFDLLVAAAADVAKRAGAHSTHVLFCTAAEQRALADRGYLPRLTWQYHFANRGWPDFEAFLTDCRAPIRKQIRRERKLAAESGVKVHVLRGAELGDTEIAALWSFYRDTTSRKWGHAYLLRGFFEALRGPLAQTAIAILAKDGDQWVAGALAFHKGDTLYGRYWGAVREVPWLHFELCYYRLIELGLSLGCARIEAGAQGEHKIKRGFLPVPIYSAHKLHHPGLHTAVAEALAHEREQLPAVLAELASHGPFHRG